MISFVSGHIPTQKRVKICAAQGLITLATYGVGC
jgi:hypothetical protein